MLTCDGCDGYYHRKCLSQRYMPHSTWRWLCPACTHKGPLVDVMRKDKYWHQAAVVEQHQSGIGTELLFDNGETDLIDLSTVRWHIMAIL